MEPHAHNSSVHAAATPRGAAPPTPQPKYPGPRGVGSLTAEIVANGRSRDALEELLGRELKQPGENTVRCWQPSRHAHGDRSPSASANVAKGVLHCHKCHDTTDIATLIIANGHARDFPGARAFALQRGWLPSRPSGAALLPAPHHGGASIVTGGTSEFPYYPEAAKRLGWEWKTDKNGTRCLSVPTVLPDGTPGRRKLRGPRIEGKVTAWFDGEHATGIGLIVNREFTDGQSREHRRIYVVAGETDLLALEHYACAWGLSVAIASGAKGERSSLEGLVELFRGAEVVVIYDADVDGRAGAATLLAELRAAGIVAASLALEFAEDEIEDGRKDLRDWLELHSGDVRKLVALADAATERAAPGPRAISAEDLLDAIDAGRFPLPEPLFTPYILRGEIVGLGGPPGAGKSFLALRMAIVAALGLGDVLINSDDDRLAFAPSKPLRVLYIDAEVGHALFGKRLRNILADIGVQRGALESRLHTQFLLVHAFDLVELGHREYVLGEIERLGPDVVVWDSVSSLLPTLDHSSGPAVRASVRDLFYEARKRVGGELTQLLLFHATKRGDARSPKSAQDRFFGTLIGWMACLDGALLLDTGIDQSDGRVHLHHAKARNCAIQTTVTMRGPDEYGRFEVLDEHERVSKRPVRQATSASAVTATKAHEAITAALEHRSSEWVTLAEVVHESSVSRSSWDRALRDGLLSELSDLFESDTHGARGARRFRLKAAPALHQRQQRHDARQTRHK
mgnify:CR=1 FL=1